MRIRACDDSRSDYEALVRLGGAELPDYAPTLDGLLRYDADARAAGRYVLRLMAEQGGQVVGHAEARELMHHPAPGRLLARVSVAPEHRRRGLGRALYERMVSLVPAQTRELVGTFATRVQGAEAFARWAGFEELDREVELRVDLEGLERPTFEVPGVTITSVAELRSSEPAWAQRLFELHESVWSDVPSDLETQPERTVDLFLREEIECPDAIPELHLVALEDGHMVGLTELRRQAPGFPLVQHLTGTRRSHRGRGIATAVKAESLRRAKALGHRAVLTQNHVDNAAMIRANEKLGFARVGVWIVVIRRKPLRGPSKSGDHPRRPPA